MTIRHAPLFTFIDLFHAAMARDNQAFEPVGQAPSRRYLNLGAGNKEFAWARSLQRPEWDAENDPIPEANATIEGIVAFHFFEHITPGRIPALLADCHRVLVPGGTLTIAVPHRLGGIAFQDLDHKSFFTTDTWRILMANDYYKTQWTGARFSTPLNLIVGDSERTLMLFTQFRKEA